MAMRAVLALIMVFVAGPAWTQSYPAEVLN